MHKSFFVLENETHRIFWDFDIPRDHLIPARKPDQGMINKKKREPIE